VGSLCVALDEADPRRCLSLADATLAHAGLFKVGTTAFATGGPALVEQLRARRPLFLDLKLHDIPAQVAATVRAAAALGVALVTVHASGGSDMMRAAVEAADARLLVVGVTLLTSLDADGLAALGIATPPTDHLIRLADLAVGAGVGGLVCSPLEVARLRRRFGPRAEGGPLLVTPGIRSAGDAPGDQRRTASVAAALAGGADVVVVGRPITRSPDPAEAARRLGAQATQG
jgi:orotidine-5'-phosphate decarboxylase